jgi:hypothetical protein
MSRFAKFQGFFSSTILIPVKRRLKTHLEVMKQFADIEGEIMSMKGIIWEKFDNI